MHCMIIGACFRLHILYAFGHQAVYSGVHSLYMLCFLYVCGAVCLNVWSTSLTSLCSLLVPDSEQYSIALGRGHGSSPHEADQLAVSELTLWTETLELLRGSNFSKVNISRSDIETIR